MHSFYSVAELACYRQSVSTLMPTELRATKPPGTVEIRTTLPLPNPIVIASIDHIAKKYSL